MNGRRHDRTGRSTSLHFSRSRRELNRPPKGESWIWLTRDLLASPAWQALSLNGRKVIDRITLEHLAHGGAENGSLPVTYSDFERHGVRRNSVRSAIIECEVLGLIRRTHPGYRARAQFGGAPQTFALTWYPTDQGEKPSNDWKRIMTPTEARRAVEEATKRVSDERSAAAATQNIDSSIASDTGSYPTRRYR
jgi:hypothetical protein